MAVLEKEGPNDGLVSVQSSRWVGQKYSRFREVFADSACQGNYMGTLENVNHLDLVGWTNVARWV